MKELILISAVLISLHSHAQNPVSLGLKGGLNIANVRAQGLEYEEYRYRMSFNAGGFVHIRLNKQFALQPELLYSGQGAKYRTTFQAADLPNTAYEWRLKYLNIPLIVQYLFSNGIYLETGPQAGFLVSAKRKDKYSEDDIKEYLKSTDLSLVFGAGFRTAFGLGFNVRYTLGFSDLEKSTEITESNRVFQIGVFYMFGRDNK